MRAAAAGVVAAGGAQYRSILALFTTPVRVGQRLAPFTVAAGGRTVVAFTERAFAGVRAQVAVQSVGRSFVVMMCVVRASVGHAGPGTGGPTTRAAGAALERTSLVAARRAVGHQAGAESRVGGLVVA